MGRKRKAQIDQDEERRKQKHAGAQSLGRVDDHVVRLKYTVHRTHNGLEPKQTILKRTTNFHPASLWSYVRKQTAYNHVFAGMSTDILPQKTRSCIASGLIGSECNSYALA
jgi:hypothetical protein